MFLKEWTLIKITTRVNVLFVNYFSGRNFIFQPSLCNVCHDILQRAIVFNNVPIVSMKLNYYRIILSV